MPQGTPRADRGGPAGARSEPQRPPPRRRPARSRSRARPRRRSPRAVDRPRRQAARGLGLTQAELAALAGVSVTTVGHAETGRTWQSRRFWERADTALRAAGDLLRLHDAYRAASSPRHGQRSTPDSIERTVSPTHPAHAPATRPAPPAHPFHVAPAQTAPAEAGRAEIGPALGDPCRVGPPVGPSRIVIVWTDGTITTVHAPEVLAGRPEAALPDLER